MTPAQWRKEFISKLDGLYPACEAEGLFFRAAEHFLGLSRLRYSLEKDGDLPAEDSGRLAEVLERLGEGLPLQYLTGVQTFYGRDFAVDGRVLIPRGETEELVRWVLDRVPGEDGKRVLDVGTGSGAIAVSLAAERPRWSVSALDVSGEALEVARENAGRWAPQVTFIQGDILDEMVWDKLDVYDVMVSNPPYVRDSERAGMHVNVTEHEPSGALFVPDADPLKFYRAIGWCAVEKLTAGGYLFFEINEALGNETAGLLVGLGFSDVRVAKDINGRDRMVSARK